MGQPVNVTTGSHRPGRAADAVAGTRLIHRFLCSREGFLLKVMCREDKLLSGSVDEKDLYAMRLKLQSFISNFSPVHNDEMRD